MEPSPAARFIQRIVDVVAIAVALAGYGVFFLATRGLWHVPPGSAIRAMELAGFMFLLGILTPIVVMIVSNFAPRDEVHGDRSARISDLAMLASFGLLALAFFYMPLVAWLRGFHLAG